ncbi:N-acetyltransferase [Pelagerythrobacter marinus]|uniref:N-acetyltransferase n=1 Tax=Pelagerythrobacter marinus TaxID=538382 RepID=UPI002036F73C|nr:N-acetyltransferase [Pelagerythrobacter marinus]USA39662.1 N-acetyltransferase [Pelagerythrobacter marinus]WPZ06208.1 N-acetyltransferase [Pelagerythrobacter marinus]
MTDTEIVIEAVEGKAGRAAFVDLGRRFSAETPNAVPQLRGEQMELLDPARNPLFDHARVQLFIARRGGRAVGRIAACVDRLMLDMPAEQGFGPGTGIFGYFDAEDESAARALLAAAEGWLREQGMTRVLGPISLSMWEEPGLLVAGHDQPPTVLMGHHPPRYQGYVENAGYEVAKRLFTYALDVSDDFPPIVRRIVQSGKRNPRIRIRPVDHANYTQDVRTVLHILNDAWSKNWGFVPFTEREIAYGAKKLRPLVREELTRIAELDGRPVAFMLALPDVNEPLARIGGRLFPFGWITMLRWLRKPRARTARVPLMGVLKEFHNSRLASQLAFMMISEIREDTTRANGTERGEIGWILEDNQGMVAIADAIESEINREYAIYRKSL